MSAIAVIYAVRPKPGHKDEVRALFGRHTPSLHAAGLITERKPLLFWSSKDEVFIESFEWKSADHARRAESTPAILSIWAEFAKLGDFVPLASLTETRNQFAHFDPL
jgi:hypothetical protein